MIRFLVAIDTKRGLANAHGIPWDLPTDKAYFRQKTDGGTILMGYGTYIEFAKPLPNRHNLVATSKKEPLKPGFEQIADAVSFLQNAKEDIWVIGGAGLFASTIDLADELYITQLEADFNCTKFFPEFEQDFSIIESGKPHTENNITFHFEVWKRK